MLSQAESTHARTDGLWTVIESGFASLRYHFALLLYYTLLRSISWIGYPGDHACTEALAVRVASWSTWSVESSKRTAPSELDETNETKIPLGFFSLPVERRHRIYDYVLISRDDTRPNRWLMDGEKVGICSLRSLFTLLLYYTQFHQLDRISLGSRLH